jgi:hypothetical protein
MDWLEEASMGATLKGKRSEDVSVYLCPHCKTFLGLALDNQPDLQAIEEMLQNLQPE